MPSDSTGGPDRARDPIGVPDLLAAAAAGDQRAWNAIVERFSGLVWSVERAHRLGPADAADVSQLVWLRLVENLGRINEPERLGGWLAAVARNECLRVLRGASREVPSTVLDDDADPDAGAGGPDGGDVDAGLLLDERTAALWRAVDTLPRQCRALLRVLMSDPRPSYEEISAALDMPIGSIGPTRQRCLERLRNSAALFGITEGSTGLLRVTRKGEST